MRVCAPAASTWDASLPGPQHEGWRHRHAAGKHSVVDPISTPHGEVVRRHNCSDKRIVRFDLGHFAMLSLHHFTMLSRNGVDDLMLVRRHDDASGLRVVDQVAQPSLAVRVIVRMQV